MNQYSHVFDTMDNQKDVGPGFLPRLPDGTHDLVLTRFDGKNSQQNRGIILEADFLIEQSTDPSLVGQKRGWPWFPQSTGWAGAHEARRWKSFCAAIDQTVGQPVRPTKVVGDELSTGMYRGIKVRASVTPRFDKNTGQRLVSNGKPISDIEFSFVAPQSLQDIQAKNASLPPEPVRPAGGQQFQNAPHPSQMPGQYPAQQAAMQPGAPMNQQQQYGYAQPQYQQQMPPQAQPQYAQPPAQPQYQQQMPPQAQPQYAPPQAPPQAQPQYAPPQGQPQYAPPAQQPYQGQPAQPQQGGPLGNVLAGLRTGNG